MTKLIEIRSYIIKENLIDEFHQLIKKESIPLQKKWGFKIKAFGKSTISKDVYYLIRCFKNEDELKTLNSDFYNSNDWINGPREKILSYIVSSIEFDFWETD